MSDEAEQPSGELPTPQRDARGRLLPGHTITLKHGGRSARVLAGAMPEQAEAAAALRERVSAIVDDLGGPDAVSHLAAGQVERYARLELVESFLWQNLQRLGPLTGKGRTRAAATLLLSVHDRLQKAALSLGLERRSKPAVLSPRALLETLSPAALPEQQAEQTPAPLVTTGRWWCSRCKVLGRGAVSEAVDVSVCATCGGPLTRASSVADEVGE